MWIEPHFDLHAFGGRRPRAVSAKTGIAFGDYQFMHVMRRARVQERRLPTPTWAVRDEWLRLLLVTYLEERFYCRPQPTLDLCFRLELAQQSALYYAPRKQELLNAWLDDYHTISHIRFTDLSDDEVMTAFLSLREVNGQLPIDVEIARNYMTGKKLRDLEIQIQNVDTDLVLTDKGHAEMIAAVVYLYYRLGWNSVTVAEELGLKSPHVRQILARLHSCWNDSLSHLDDSFDADGQCPSGSRQGGQSQTGATPSASPFDELFGELQ